MNGLGELIYVNEYATIVEVAKADGHAVSATVWPSDAPAAPRSLADLRRRSPEIYIQKAMARRRALLRSAVSLVEVEA